MKYVTTVGDQKFKVEIQERGSVLINGQPHTIDLQEIISGRLFSLLLDHRSHEAFVEDSPTLHSKQYQVLLRGELYQVTVEDERAIRLARSSTAFVADSGEIAIQAPMPGLIVNVPVTAGQAVKQGDILVVLESMKMDNELCAPRDGTVAQLHIEAGDSVEGRQTLVTLA